MSNQEEADNLGAVAAGMMAQSAVVLDTTMSRWAASETTVRIQVQGTTHIGKLFGFDGERICLVDDLGVPILIYLKSGIAVIGPKASED